MKLPLNRGFLETTKKLTDQLHTGVFSFLVNYFVLFEAKKKEKNKKKDHVSTKQQLKHLPAI